MDKSVLDKQIEDDKNKRLSKKALKKKKLEKIPEKTPDQTRRPYFKKPVFIKQYKKKKFRFIKKYRYRYKHKPVTRIGRDYPPLIIRRKHAWVNNRLRKISYKTLRRIDFTLIRRFKKKHKQLSKTKNAVEPWFRFRGSFTRIMMRRIQKRKWRRRFIVRAMKGGYYYKWEKSPRIIIKAKKRLKIIRKGKRYEAKYIKTGRYGKYRQYRKIWKPYGVSVRRRFPLWLSNLFPFIHAKHKSYRILKNLRILRYLLRFLKFYNKMLSKKRLLFFNLLINTLTSLITLYLRM